MKKVLLGLFLFFIVNSNLFSQTVIKMKREGGISIIPCKVNGLNLNFIFDTGASNVSLSMTEATFMLKNGYLSESDILGTNKFSDATGKISEGVIINLKEIEIAGADMVFYPAKAIIKNNKIIVSSEKVLNPVAVHYGWADDDTEINLFNKEKFPASPFRTDNWEMITANEKYKVNN